MLCYEIFCKTRTYGGVANSEKYVIIKKIHSLICQKVRLYEVCRSDFLAEKGKYHEKSKGVTGLFAG